MIPTNANAQKPSENANMTVVSLTPRMPIMFDSESASSFRSTISAGQNGNGKKRSVTFSDDVEVVEILHVNDFTDEEYHEYWLTPVECRIISEMAGITVGLMDLGGDEDLETICFRGLEGRTAETGTLYAQKYQEVVQSVLKEQERQRKRRRNDSAKLARASYKLTRGCRKIAEKYGRLDEFEARQLSSR